MPRDATILIRLTKEEKARINEVARAAGSAVSVWVREALMEKAGRDSGIKVTQEEAMRILDGLNSPVLPQSSPVEVNGDPPLDIPEIPLSDPGPYTTDPAYGDSEEPPIESGYWLDGEWVPD